MEEPGAADQSPGLIVYQAMQKQSFTIGDDSGCRPDDFYQHYETNYKYAGKAYRMDARGWLHRDVTRRRLGEASHVGV